jgi:choline dehydrogenase
VCQLRPESTGEIALRSADPEAAPVIRANYLAAPTDRRVMRDGFKIMRDILAQPAFDPHRGPPIAPDKALKTDDEIDAFIAANASTVFHPVGTCRMGLHDDAVVDEALRVRGIEGLRVADASVMPRLVSSNTHAPTVMIAERAADMMLGEAARAQASSDSMVSIS